MARNSRLAGASSVESTSALGYSLYIWLFTSFAMHTPTSNMPAPANHWLRLTGISVAPTARTDPRDRRGRPRKRFASSTRRGRAHEKIPSVEDGTTTTRLDPDTGERFLPLRRQLGVSSFGFNQIVLGPGQRGRIHRHQRQEEVYLVQEGTLTIVIEGEATDLGQGELIRVAPQIRRQLVNRGPGRLVLLALGGANDDWGAHPPRDGEAFGDWSEDDPVPPQELPMPPDLEPGELRTS